MTAGAVLFARYAYPPGALGYCGPEDARGVLEAAATGRDDPEVHRLLRGFEGAWPYLTLIAAAAGLRPLDAAVVEAYWVGNDLLRRPTAAALGRLLEEQFHRRLSPAGWAGLTAAAGVGGVAHHSYHVLAVYPWVGLLRGGRTEPLRVLDRCRIRWGQVTALTGDRAVVRSAPLRWDGRVLSLGAARAEEARVAADGLRLPGGLAVGDWCALHWDWVCDRLSARQLTALRRVTAHHLALVNAAAAPAPGW